mgnify:CR=1 FL=1
MKRGSFATGFLTGLLVVGVTTTAYAAGIMAERSTHRVFVDGREVQMEAYVINGNNYVKLRDIGKAVGFEVYWDSENGCVQVESGKPYTGEAPAKVEPDKPLSRPEDTSTTIDVNALKQDIIDRTNALRKENGVAVLRVNDKLMQAAQVRADEMAASGVYSHTRPDGRKYTTVTDCKYIGENIHLIGEWQIRDSSLPSFAVEAWKNSAAHLKNMLNTRYHAIGVGVSQGTVMGEPYWYCVQLFLLDGYNVTWVDAPAAKG